MTAITENLSPGRLIKLKEVMNKTSLGSSTIYRRIEAGVFPKPRRLGPNCVRWLESDVDRWIEALPGNE